MTANGPEATEGTRAKSLFWSSENGTACRLWRGSGISSVPNRSRKSAEGATVVTWKTRSLTILNPGTAALLPLFRSAAPTISATSFTLSLVVSGEDTASTVYSKSCDVIGTPSLHRSPGRSVNVYVRPSGEIDQRSARSGNIRRLGL